MPLTVTRILDLGLIDGTVTLPERRIPDAVHTIGVYLHRWYSGDPTIWADPSTYIETKLKISFDDRKNWVDRGFGAFGGLKLIDLLTESRYSGTTFRVPYIGQQRWITGQIIIFNGPVKTAIEIASVT